MVPLNMLDFISMDGLITINIVLAIVALYLFIQIMKSKRSNKEKKKDIQSNERSMMAGSINMMVGGMAVMVGGIAMMVGSIKQMRKITIPSDLLIILIWTITTFTFAIIPTLENSIVRTILGIPAVLFIPGYVLIATLFPKKDNLEAIERIALSLGLSIAVVPLLGLLLNFTFGIKLVPILITLSLYTIILILCAIYRRGKLSEDERFSVHFHETYKNIIVGISPKNNVDGILTGVLIFVIILAIGMVYFAITTPKIGERFTEFYVLNNSGKADSYQTNLEADRPVTYLVGVANHEYVPINYTIKVALDKDVLTSKELRLSHNDTWEDSMTLTPNKKGTDMMLEFWLFKDNNLTEPYRKLHLWVNST